VLLAAYAVNVLDAIAAEELGKLVLQLRDQGPPVALSGLEDGVLDVLHRTRTFDVIGKGAIFPTQARAIEATHAAAHEGMSESPCPLLEVVARGRFPPS